MLFFQTNLKRGQGASDRPGSVEKKEKVPEFQKFKLRKVSADRAKTEEETRDNELMRKLGKQKKAAEGEGMIIFQISNELCIDVYYK